MLQNETLSYKWVLKYHENIDVWKIEIMHISSTTSSYYEWMNEGYFSNTLKGMKKVVVKTSIQKRF